MWEQINIYFLPFQGDRIENHPIYGLSVIPGLNENTVYIVLDGYIEAYIIVYFIFSRFNSRNV